MDSKFNHPPDARSGGPCDLLRIGVGHLGDQRLPDAPGDYVRR
jgi:hypothetical protein